MRNNLRIQMILAVQCSIIFARFMRAGDMSGYDIPNNKLIAGFWKSRGGKTRQNFVIILLGTAYIEIRRGLQHLGITILPNLLQQQIHSSNARY